MRFRFVLSGTRYTKHKGAFKKLLQEHGLRWRGDMTEFVWESRRERVHAEYERDEDQNVTVRATLVWEGRAKTPFLNELKAWVFSVGGKSARQKVGEEDAMAVNARLERELTFWDRIHKPDVEALRAAGRPVNWIEQDLKRWKRKREARRRELRRD